MPRETPTIARLAPSGAETPGTPCNAYRPPCNASTGELCRIVVPFDPARLSPNQRGHWRKREAARKAAREAALAGWRCAGSPQAPGPVRLSYIVHRGRRMDDDNLIAGCKHIRDGLCGPGMLAPSDGPRFVTHGTVTQETGARFSGRNARVIVIVTVEPLARAGSEEGE